jgi:hypothetical protein
MIDTFRKHSRSLTSPPEEAAAIVPDDAADLPFATRALYVGGEGDLKVRMLGGGVVTLAGVPAGVFLPLRVSRVFATDTTASALVGFW